jgi:electron transport complex protein RnfG
MKKENLVQYVLRLTVTLLAITGLVAAALAGVNAITKDAIAANQEKKTQDALALVLPDAGNLQKQELTADAGIVSEVYTDGQSYAVKVLPSGFDGTITMMVGIADGKVTGISVISHTETPGLGAVAAAQNAKGEAFRSQFVGQEGTLSIGNQIDAMSGATITSTAVVTGVNAALSYVANMG